MLGTYDQLNLPTSCAGGWRRASRRALWLEPRVDVFSDVALRDKHYEDGALSGPSYPTGAAGVGADRVGDGTLLPYTAELVSGRER